jgi:hypothetical protein
MPIAFLAFITVAAAVASVIWLPEDKPTSCERSGVRPGRTLDWNPANVLFVKVGTSSDRQFKSAVAVS